MRENKQRRWLLALIIIAVVIIASVGIALSYRDKPGSIPMSSISDGSDGTIIAWHSGEGIYVQHINASGQTLWKKGGVLLSEGKTEFDPYGPPQIYFTLASDGTGGAIIAWADESQRPTDFNDPAHFDPLPFYVQRVSTEGELMWNDSYVSVGERWQVVPDGMGGAIIAWNGYKTHYKVFHDDYLHLQKIAPDGRRLWDDEGVILVTSSPYRPLTQEELNSGIKGTTTRSHPTYAGTHDIVSDSSGGVIVIWEEEGTQNDYQVYAKRMDSEGDPAWNEKVIVGSGNYRSDSISADGFGGAYLVLSSSDAGTAYQKHISHGGELLATTTYSPNTISDGLGGIIRIRIEAIPPYGDPSLKRNVIYVQRLDKEGIPIWTEKQVLSTQELYQISNLKYIADGSGGIFLFWQLQKGYVTYGATFVQRLDAEGNIQLGEKGLAVFGVPDKYQGNAQILSDGSGGVLVVAVVGNNAFGGNMIYAQHIDDNGRLLWKSGIRIDR
ncbi:MAG: hypothetical protein PHN78_00400 [Dehalococcoidales bacterium]|nr:hypothetical protein [Dehalococcoidales bacterium]